MTKITCKVSPKSDPYILLVFGTDGNTYYYGVFNGRPNAIQFAQKECNGFKYEAKRLSVVER